MSVQASLFSGHPFKDFEPLKTHIDDMYLNFEITSAFMDADESIIAPADALIRILLNPLTQ